jgi:hypothetical protein
MPGVLPAFCADLAEAAADVGVSAPSSFLPHVPQNRCPGGFEAPQLGQPEARADPQLPQNRWSADASAPHVEQVITSGR